MTITITTSSKYRKTVMEILRDMDLVHAFVDDREDGLRQLILVYPDDSQFLSVTAWGADALACGLIFGFQVER